MVLPFERLAVVTSGRLDFTIGNVFEMTDRETNPEKKKKEKKKKCDGETKRKTKRKARKEREQTMRKGARERAFALAFVPLCFLSFVLLFFLFFLDEVMKVKAIHLCLRENNRKKAFIAEFGQG